MDGWKFVPFEDVVRSRGAGASGLPTSEWQNSGAYPVIGQGAQEIEGWTDRSDLVLSFSSGVVLYGGHTRRAKHVERPFVPGPNVKILEPVQGLDSRFLFHYLTHLPIESKGYADHFPLVRKASVPVPPEEEQRRIVAILDEAFDAIATAKANTEKNLQNARELFDAQLQMAFTRREPSWPERTLGELGTITSSKRIFASEYTESGVPFFRTKEVKQLANGDEITTELFISVDRFISIRNDFGAPKAGDLLLTAIGTIGEIYVVDDIGDFYFKDGNVLWLKDFKSVSPHFLKYALQSFVEGLNRLARGSAYSALPINKLNCHRIVVPPEGEQRKVVERLDELKGACGQLETAYERKVASLEELKKSLLHQAFTGQLTAKATDKQLAEVA